MQYNINEFDENLHDKFKILTVKQPNAGNLINVYRNDGDYNLAYRSIEVRRKSTNYRGDVLICSSETPIVYGLYNRSTIGFVELFGIKPLSEFTHNDWEKTLISEDKRKYFKNGFGWLFRNPRRVIEYPVITQLGFSDLVYTKDDIIEYPVLVELDKKAFDKINKKK